MIQPMNDRVLISRIEDVEKIGSIIVPDVAKVKSFKGVVVAVGPGKRISGSWWSIKQADGTRKWEWEDSYRRPVSLRVGQIVIFNSRWDDLTDGYEKLGQSDHDRLHLVQEADIIGTLTS